MHPYLMSKMAEHTRIEISRAHGGALRALLRKAR